MNEGSIMIGWPHETREQLKKTMGELPHYNLHMIRPSIYTPFPGTIDYRMMKKKGLINEKNWSKYDTNHLVFRHNTFTDRELRNIQKDLLKYFYTHPKYQKRIHDFTKKHPQYKKSFDEFLSIIKF